MKQLLRILLLPLAAFALAFVVLSLAPQFLSRSESTNDYRIGANRVEHAVRQYEATNGRAPASLNDLNTQSTTAYPSILSMELYPHDAFVSAGPSAALRYTDTHYLLFATELASYRLNYTLEADSDQPFLVLTITVVAILFLVVLVALLRIYQNILRPFAQFSELPATLAKGELAVPVKEYKTRYFGRFLWGIELLRQTLEDNKARELALQREKKLLLLSLSHDIKTPLSAIKLYSSALGKNLYTSEDRKNQIVKSISAKADEIDTFVTEIVHASKEDFLEFHVNNTEFYLLPTLARLKDYYKERLEQLGTEFVVTTTDECLLHGDEARFLEVLQNLMENAIKYGDGRKIVLTIEASTDCQLFHIKNSGAVLPSSEFPHLFDSFYRGSNAKRQPGSGLGLFICRKLMHLMDGEIYADVENLDGAFAMVFTVVVKRC